MTLSPPTRPEAKPLIVGRSRMTPQAEKPKVEPKPHDFFQFKPEKDITAYELAMLLASAGVDMNYQTWLRMPSAIQRHFVPVPRNADGKRR